MEPRHISSLHSASSAQAVFARYYKILTALIVILLAAGSYFLILKPKYDQVGVGGKYNVETLRTELKKRQDYLRNVQALSTNYRNINRTEIDKVKTILPTEEDIPGLLVQLQTIAERNGIFLSGVSINDVPDPDKTKSSLHKINVSLNLIGTPGKSYEDVKRFLSEVEYNVRLFDVAALYFSPDSPNYSVSLITYYYAAP
jgi:Tfp pilus assembly protein PilO